MMAAKLLANEGHAVTLHARNGARAAAPGREQRLHDACYGHIEEHIRRLFVGRARGSERVRPRLGRVALGDPGT